MEERGGIFGYGTNQYRSRSSRRRTRLPHAAGPAIILPTLRQLKTLQPRSRNAEGVAQAQRVAKGRLPAIQARIRRGEEDV